MGFISQYSIHLEPFYSEGFHDLALMDEPSHFACQLLFEYMEVNRNLFSDPSPLFEHFVQGLSDGTIDDQGYDSSGLFWLPRRASNVNQLLSALNGLTDWLELHNRGSSLNPFTEAML